MALCSSCGAQNADNTLFCTQCGASLQAPPVVAETPRQLATGQLVFSIINIVLGCCSLNGIMGIIALIMTIVAKNAATDEDAEKKLRVAKILNIVALVACLIGTMFAILYLAFGGFTVIVSMLGQM
ncbi:MAG: zinc-ribbon domain-containing protein [Ruminococcaceae bacterium]|nr:zinc-ribbon domain-containing protein [Oscillospiraceae bacterium]